MTELAVEERFHGRAGRGQVGKAAGTIKCLCFLSWATCPFLFSPLFLADTARLGDVRAGRALG